MWSRRRCDLQDIALVFGSDRGRFYENNKRSVTNLNSCGPLIKTIMTRCIHCTRCVRFLSEVAGIEELGVMYRGFNMKIATYVEKFLDSELSGNIIDLCPVGALTSMPFAFSSRAWDFNDVYSIDILDAFASSIRIDVSNNCVMRVVPLLDCSLNENWITNKVRFSYDSLNLQRLNYPKIKLNSKFVNISWDNAIIIFINYMIDYMNENIMCIFGELGSLELVCSLKEFFNYIGCNNIYYSSSLYNYNCDFRFLYLLNVTLLELDEADMIILVGSNLRLESPLLCSRIRKLYLSNDYDLPVFSFGLNISYLTFPVYNIGNSISSLMRFVNGKMPVINSVFSGKYLSDWYFLLNNIGFYTKPLILLGTSILYRMDNQAIITLLFNFIKLNKNYLNEYWKCFHVISVNLGLLSSLELGLSSKIKYDSKNFVYLCGTDKFDFSHKLGSKDFIVYQGPIVSSANIFNYINLELPSTAYTESNSTYINLEGRYRFTTTAVTPFKQVRTDSDIITALFLSWKLKFSTNFSNMPNFNLIKLNFKNIINFDNIFLTNQKFEHLIGYNANIKSQNETNLYYDNLFKLFVKNKLINSVLCPVIGNYYSTDIFVRNSKIMGLCSLKIKNPNF
jgi:NADH dehydrogenase/NADH:ubiquinone oxidoreductase subunit G